jgi:hypothetical protein
VQQAKGLVGACIHGHAAHQIVVTNFQKLNAQMAHSGVDAAGGKAFQGDGLLPNAHADSKRKVGLPL